MVNISFNEMYLYEDYLLEAIGTFVNDALGLDVFLLDQPWPAQITPSVGIRVLTYGDSGGWGYTDSREGERGVAITDLSFTIEFVARSGRPMAALAYLIQALRGFEELKYQHLYSKGIGTLSVSNAAPANTVFDGDETEQRARMTANFNARIKALDIPGPDPIEKISGSIFTNIVAPDFAYGGNRLYEFFNGDSVEGDTEEQTLLERGKMRAITQTFNVDISTT